MKYSNTVRAFAEVGLDGQLDDLTGRVGHQTAHPRQLGDLGHVPPGTGVGHHVDRVEFAQFLHQDVGNLILGLTPDGNDPLVPLFVGDQAAPVLLHHQLDLFFRLFQDLLLLFGHHHVGDGHGDSRLGGVGVTQLFDLIQNDGRLGGAEPAETLGDNRAQEALLHRIGLRKAADLLPDVDALFKDEVLIRRAFHQVLFGRLVDIGECFRENLVEDQLADRGDQKRVLLLFGEGRPVQPAGRNGDPRMQGDQPLLIGLNRFTRCGEDASLRRLSPAFSRVR